MQIHAQEPNIHRSRAEAPTTTGVSLSLDDRLTDQLGRVLGVDGSSDELALARSNRQTLGAMLVRSLSDKTRGEALLAPADVHRIVPRRTWVRRKAEGGLTGAEFDGLYRLVRLQLLADLVFGDSGRAQEWLHSAKARLGGVTPMDFAADSLGHEAVETWLHEIDQGYFA
jgi:putative toxin-antitoxin system antitoxin component (TIGR02293 family)